MQRSPELEQKLLGVLQSRNLLIGKKVREIEVKAIWPYNETEIERIVTAINLGKHDFINREAFPKGPIPAGIMIIARLERIDGGIAYALFYDEDDLWSTFQLIGVYPPSSE